KLAFAHEWSVNASFRHPDSSVNPSVVTFDAAHHVISANRNFDTGNGTNTRILEASNYLIQRTRRERHISVRKDQYFGINMAQCLVYRLTLPHPNRLL